MFVVYYFIMMLPVVFLVLLNRVFIKGEYLDVGSGKYLSAANQTAIILIFKNITFFRNCLLCLSLGVFYREVVWVVCCGCSCD